MIRLAGLAVMLWIAWPIPLWSQSTEVPVGMTRLGLELDIDYGARSLGGTATIGLRNVVQTPVSEFTLLLNRLMSVKAIDERGRAIPSPSLCDSAAY